MQEGDRPSQLQNFLNLPQRFVAGISTFLPSPPKPNDGLVVVSAPPPAVPTTRSGSSSTPWSALTARPEASISTQASDAAGPPRLASSRAAQPMAPPYSPASGSGKGKAREGSPWGGGGWGDNGSADDLRGRYAQSAEPSRSARSRPPAGGSAPSDVYEVDLSKGIKVSDRAQAYESRLLKNGDHDEVEFTGTSSGPRPAPGLGSGFDHHSQHRYHQRQPPPPTMGRSARRQSSNGQAIEDRGIPIRVPREERPSDPSSLAGGRGGRGPQGGSGYRLNPEHQTLKGAKVAGSSSSYTSVQTKSLQAAQDVERRQELKRSQDETRSLELIRREEEGRSRPRKSVGTPFQLGKNSINPQTSSTSRPPPGQVPGPSAPGTQSHHFLPASNRNGSDRHGSSSSSHRPTTNSMAQTPTQAPRRNGPTGDSRVFAINGDDALMAPHDHSNKEAVLFSAKGAKAPLPSFKKNTPVAPPVPRDRIDDLAQKRPHKGALEVIDLSDDDSPQVPLSQQSEDIGSFGEADGGPPSGQKSPAVRRPAAATDVRSLVDNRPEPNLNSLPVPRALKPRPAPPDDDAAVPINVPKQGTIKKSVVGSMGSSRGGFLHNSVPTATTRGQSRQLAGGSTLGFPECRFVHGNEISRKCRLAIHAEQLAVTTIAFVPIVELPLFFVHELQYSNHSDGEQRLLRVTLDVFGLPAALYDFRETTFVWQFPHPEARKLDNAWAKLPNLPALQENRRHAGEQKKKLKMTPMTKAQTNKMFSMLEPDSGKKPLAPARVAPATTRARAAAVDLGPIAIDDSDDDGVDFPSAQAALAARTQKSAQATRAPPSAQARGKQRETRTTARAESPREPPPENPHELMCNWPATGRPEISILKGDYYRTTHKDEYLNDTIIDWGLKRSFAAERANNSSLEDDVYIFSSFLYFKLTEPHVLKAKKDPWENVRSWTTKKVEGKKEKELKIDLFKKKYIIVPINESYHWYLAIIVNPAAVLQTPPPPKSPLDKKVTAPSKAKTTRAATSTLASEPMDVDGEPEDGARTSLSTGSSELLVVEPRPPAEEPQDETATVEDSEMPPSLDDAGGSDAPERENGFVFILDSLGNATVKPAAVLSKYLRSEGVAHQGWDAAAEATTLIADKVDVPRQGDESSCGVYLLHYAEVFMRDPAKAVDFMLNNRKPKRNAETTISFKEAMEKHNAERDAFWEEPQLAGKRAGYRQALLDLEKEFLASEHAKVEGREPSTSTEVDQPVSSPVIPATASEVTAAGLPPPQTGSALPSQRASPASDADQLGESGPAESIAPASLAASAQPAESAAERLPSDEPEFSPPTPPDMGSVSQLPSPSRQVGDRQPADETDPLDLGRLRRSLPRQSEDNERSTPGRVDDELASHLSATPSDEQEAPESAPPRWATTAHSPSSPRVSAPAPVGPRPSKEEVAVQTQTFQRSASSSPDEPPKVDATSRPPPTPVTVYSSDEDRTSAVKRGPSKKRILLSQSATVHDDSDDEMDLLADASDDARTSAARMRKRSASPSASSHGAKRQRHQPPSSTGHQSQPARRFRPSIEHRSPDTSKGKGPPTAFGGSTPGGSQPRYKVHIADDGPSAAVPPPRTQLPKTIKNKRPAHDKPLKKFDVVELDDEDVNSDDSSVTSVKHPDRDRQSSHEC